MKKINERLKKIRKKRGMNQQEMAEVLEIGVSAYSKIETGINELTTKHLLTIKREFKASIDWLLFGDDANILKGFGKNKEDVNAMLKDMKANRMVLHSILSHYYGLCDKIKKKVIDVEKKRNHF